MELTAIKIPGKNTRDQRRRKYTVVDGAVSKKSSVRPKRGRPMRSSKSLSLSSSRASTPITQKPSKKPRTLRNIKSRHKLQPIEKLPTEIITRIFLFNPTPCLALASPILAARLSNEYVYNKTLLLIFGPYWELQFREWEDKGSRENELEIDESIEDLPPEPSSYTQSSILRCRWVTLARLRYAESSFLLQKQKELMEGPRCLVFPTRYEPLLDDFFISDWEGFVDEVPEIGYEEWKVEERHTKPLLRFRDEVVEIPVSVLCAPWTEAKVQYLWYLWRVGAKIEKFSSTAGEEATSGLEAAILSCNIHAIYLLSQFSISTPLTTPLILQFLRNLLKLSLLHDSDNDSFPSAQKTISSSSPSTSKNLSSLASQEQMKIKDVTKVLDAFISYFAGREKRENRRPERRRAEVEREILELRRGFRRGSSQGGEDEEEEKERRKQEGEWMVGVLGEIYGLAVGS